MYATTKRTSTYLGSRVIVPVQRDWVYHALYLLLRQQLLQVPRIACLLFIIFLIHGWLHDFLEYSYCSNRGICDFNTGICTCFEDFTNANCDTYMFGMRGLDSFDVNDLVILENTRDSFSGISFFLSLIVLGCLLQAEFLAFTVFQGMFCSWAHHFQEHLLLILLRSTIVIEWIILQFLNWMDMVMYWWIMVH